ncbi:ADP-ribose glycohydrolase OARD1-like [Acanthochromis polyacanthus]|uniref:ADP-ribose glycohydrolase OARD1-like n=1 Tax=Acanthochromis polyacanthus TaxID=80966 RepID=UPI002234501F|nr:ADP-ribose glycohydrolase OARD1-like [Acanthochromis polyacanthus]
MADRRSPQVKPELLKQVTGNLFDCPNDEALAHCISADCRMGAGIAVLFKQKFKGVSELLKQRKAPGQCAVLLREGRFIYYLVTKQRAFHKPTYSSLLHSLEDMRSHCIRNGVHKLSMPRIGCGLDQLEWTEVAKILERVFMGTGITITIYSLPWTAASMN